MNTKKNRLEASLHGSFLKTFFTVLLLTAVGAVNASGMELQSSEDGSPTSLDSLTGNGKWTLVMIWATNCHICKIQKPEMSAFHNERKDVDAHIVGIALDGPKHVDIINQYIEDNNVSFPTFVGDTAIIASHYFGMTEENLRGTPTYLLFNPEGELLANNPGLLTVEALENFIASRS